MTNTLDIALNTEQSSFTEGYHIERKAPALEHTKYEEIYRRISERMKSFACRSDVTGEWRGNTVKKKNFFKAPAIPDKA